MIFEHALTVPQEIKVLPPEFEGERIETPAGHQSEQVNIAALLLVNKQTHSETRQLLYERNTFCFSTGIVENLNSSAFSRFVNSVTKENLACVRRIAISPYLPRRAWVGERRRGQRDELKRMVRAAMKHLAGVEDVELNLDGPYGPPVSHDPDVEIEKGSSNLRQLKTAVKILERRKGLRIRLRAGSWLDIGKVKKLLKKKTMASVVVD
jgi:hypothetical protein